MTYLIHRRTPAEVRGDPCHGSATLMRGKSATWRLEALVVS